MFTPRHTPVPQGGPYPNTDLEPYETMLETNEVTPQNPPVYPGRRFQSRGYSLGLTLRDQVANDVLAYLITDESSVDPHQSGGRNRTLAMKAFAMADAFLEERNRNV